MLHLSPSLQAKKSHEAVHDKYQDFMAGGANKSNMDKVNKTLSIAYSVMFEGRVCELVLNRENKTVQQKKNTIESELAKLSKYSKAFDNKIKAEVHESIFQEATSIMLDA